MVSRNPRIGKHSYSPMPKENSRCEMTLHTFVDASQQAHGASCYTRHLCKNETVSAYLVASRSRVTTMHAISIS